MPEPWKDSISVPIYKKGDKNDCANKSLLSTTHKIVLKLICITLIPRAPVKCHNSILPQAPFKIPSTCI